MTPSSAKRSPSPIRTWLKSKACQRFFGEPPFLDVQLRISSHQLLRGRTNFLLLLPLRLRSQLMVAPSPTQCSQEAGTARFCHKLDTVPSVFLSVTGSHARPGSHARLPAPSSHAAQSIEWYHRIRRWHHRTAQWDKSNTGATRLAAAEAWLLILIHTEGLIGPLDKEETRRRR